MSEKPLRGWASRLILCFTIILAFPWGFDVNAAERIPFPVKPVTIARVIDGDTFAIEALPGIATDANNPDECKYRVRLIGLDTPERGRLGYEEAKQELEKLLPPETLVLLTPDLDERDGASPWRWLAYVGTDDGKDVGAEMVRSGWAVAWRYLPNCARHDYYRSLMYDAFTEERGLFDPELTDDDGLSAVYVASDDEDCYHRPGCGHTERIKLRNIVCVLKAQDFVTAGKVACKHCLNPEEVVWD
ncbi:MAG TPA: thermonuclease family protein [bacterium]|nr:thermonuclease family protein [bacterium]